MHFAVIKTHIIVCLVMIEESGRIPIIAVDLSRKTTNGVSIISFRAGNSPICQERYRCASLYGIGVCPFHLVAGVKLH